MTGGLFEPDPPRRIRRICPQLALGEGARVDVDAGVGREGRVLRGPVFGELEPGRFGQDRRVLRLIRRAGGIVIPSGGLAAQGQCATEEQQRNERREPGDVPEGDEVTCLSYY